MYILLPLFLLMYAANLYGYQTEAEVFLRTSERCSKYFSYFENKYNLPNRLLQSVALAETGRWDASSKQLVPWPWTVNQGGKAYFFDSKRDAVSAVQQMLNQGVTNIDVGCMQVNLGYHSKSFKSLLHAFEPRYNVEFGAELLSNHYLRFANWSKAIAAYHSMSEIGKDYYHRVINMWYKTRVISATQQNATKQVEVRKDIQQPKMKFYHKMPKMNPARLKSKIVVE